MKPLWTCWPSLQRTAISAKRLVLCLDYDGTLTPIVNHPTQARLPAQTRRLLERLARQSNICVILVSGRALDDLKALVGIRGLYYVGNHGLELHGPRLRYVNPVAQNSRPLLRQMARSLQAALRPIPRAWVEDKGLSLSLHWRQTPPWAHRPFRRLITRYTAPYLEQELIRVTRGKRVLEIRPPVAWDKGHAIAWLLSRLPRSPLHARSCVMYFGDDETDEDAFRLVNRYRGISVFVGSSRRATAARWVVRNPHDVGETLADILQERWKATRAL